MKDMRKFLSVSIITIWGSTIILVLFMMLFNLIDIGKGQEILKTFSSVTSGFVGMILGFYFTSQDKKP